MAELIRGKGALELRMKAVSSSADKGITQKLALSTVREAKLLVHRRTGNLGRSIHVAEVTEKHALVIASANYAADVEFGTRPHEITPNAKKALRWAASPSGRRLSGAPRKGAAVIFATKVHHPGTKPYPYLIPGAKAAVQKGGLRDVVIQAWNDAA